MTCKGSSNITFEFVNDSGDTVLEILPRSMQFDRSRGEFDFCKAEFSAEVADHLSSFLDREDSVFRQPLPVNVLIEGDKIHQLLYIPDAVWINEDNVHIEFHDQQKYLSRGKVNYRRKKVKLKDAYKDVFDKRNKKGAAVFEGIKFTTSDQSYDALAGDNRRYYDEKDYFYNRGANVELEEDLVYNIIDGKYAVDFDKISPWKCINELNEKFGVDTWVGSDGYLWVGSRKATAYKHIAAKDDKRVWKLSDYSLNQPRDPVVRSIVRGGWADDPSESSYGFSPELEALNIGTKDFRVEGVASVDSDSYLGQELYEERIEAKRDTLEAIATKKLQKKQREQASGYLDINPEFSGTEHTDVRFVKIGDNIVTIPSDNSQNGNCESSIGHEIFDVVGVQHILEDGGNWNVRIKVIKELDGDLDISNIKTKLRYYDPSSDEYITEDEYSANEELEGDFFWGRPQI